MEKELILESDYQKGKDPVPIVAVVHAIIKTLHVSIDIEDLSYKLLKPSSVDECMDLEMEWFPYEPENRFFYKSLQRKKVKKYFTLCCYWRPKGQKAEYVIGNIQVKICKDSDTMKYLRHNKFDPRQKEEELQENLKNNEEKTIAYVHSIGVIDEARRLGIGTKLLELAAEYARRNNPNCVGISLNVIATGKRAVALYEKSKFVRLFTVPNYYDLNGKFFDSYFYAKAFDKNYNDKDKKNIAESIKNLILDKTKIAINKVAGIIWEGLLYVNKSLGNDNDTWIN